MCSLRCGVRLAAVCRPTTQRTRRIRTVSSGLDPTVETVPQRVSAALRSRQDAVKGLESRLEASNVSQQVVREVVHEFQSLHEQVQQLAQHLEALDSRAQAKSAEKAMKKERKAAEKAAKKERKAAEKAAKLGTEITGGFDEQPLAASQDINSMVVGTVAGDTSFDLTQLGSNIPQLDGHTATTTPVSSASAPSAATISVCQGKDCKKQGGESLLQYVQSTAGPEISVVGCKCLGKCEQAPNLRVELPDQKPAVHTTVQNGQDVQNILSRTKAQYGKDVMKSFALVN